MKEATDATLGAEHHGSPAGMLLFQRSNPRGGRKQAGSALRHPPPQSLGLVRPLAPPDGPQACLQVPKPRAQAALPKQKEEPRGRLVFWSWQQGDGCCEGQMWAPAVRICPPP